MSRARTTLLTHPARARILTGLMGRPLTAQQLAAVVPEVPLPSLYRHLKLLVDEGVVDDSQTVRVRGALTRVYAVRHGMARIRPEDTAGSTRADYLRYFSTFLNTLSETFRVYLARDDAQPERPHHSLMTPLRLNDDEYRQFVGEIQEVIQRWMDRPPAPDSRRLIFAHIAVPDTDEPPHEGDPT